MSGLALLAFTGALLYAQRAAFIVPAGRYRLPDAAERMLVHARPAVLGALLATVVAPGGAAGIDGRAVVVAVIGLAAARRTTMAGTVAAGLATLLAMAALVAIAT